MRPAQRRRDEVKPHQPVPGHVGARRTAAPARRFRRGRRPTRARRNRGPTYSNSGSTGHGVRLLPRPGRSTKPADRSARRHRTSAPRRSRGRADTARSRFHATASGGLSRCRTPWIQARNSSRRSASSRGGAQDHQVGAQGLRIVPGQPAGVQPTSAAARGPARRRRRPRPRVADHPPARCGGGRCRGGRASCPGMISTCTQSKSAKPAAPRCCATSTTPEPAPGPGEVLIKAEAIGVNYIDTYFRSGQYPRELPFVLGSELCGTVAATGDGADGFGVGDRVVSASASGGYAEYATAPAFLTAHVPDGVSSDVAASVLLKGLTAHYLLKSVYPVQAGDTVLVHAGAGGVGLILTQWAHLLGARVITTVSTPEKARLSRQAGADEVLSYPDDADEFGRQIRGLTDGAGVDGRVRRRRRHHLRRQPGQPGRAGHAGAVRGGQRSRSVVRSAAPQRRRLGVSDPAVAGPLHPHRPGIQLAGRANCSTRSPAGPSPSRSAGAIRSPKRRAPTRTCRAARRPARSCCCPRPIKSQRPQRPLAWRHWQGPVVPQSRCGSAITESTANAQNTTAR